MTDSEKVDAYIQKHDQWSDELNTLRSLFQKTELKKNLSLILRKSYSVKY